MSLAPPLQFNAPRMGTGGREHYYFIDFLRAVACFLVVFHHCLDYFGTASLATFYTLYLRPYFPTVTLYLLVSGFVHCGVIEKKSLPYAKYVSDKFKRILVPYFCISLLTLFLRVIAERTHAIPLDQVQYTPFLWSEAVLRLLFSGVEGHYYFLQVLFVYLLFFPFLLKRLEKPRSAMFLFLVVLAVDPFLGPFYARARSPLTDWSPLALLAALLSGFKFFLFGFVLNRYYRQWKEFLGRYGVVVGIFCLALFSILRAQFPAAHEYWVFIELFGYFAMALAVCNTSFSLVNRISAVSFGIYLLHQPYFLKFSRLLLSRWRTFPNVQFLSTWALTLVLTIAAIKLIEMNRLLSRLLLGKT